MTKSHNTQNSRTLMVPKMHGCLVLEDGTVIRGEGIGAGTTVVGELVFNTAMTGYQESLTDPSYSGQTLMFTYPMIGNYGISDQANESGRVQVKGTVMREWCRVPSHRFSRMTINRFLEDQGVPGLAGVDTRALTVKTRTSGTMRSVLSVSEKEPDACELRNLLEETPNPSLSNLVANVSIQETRKIDSPSDLTIALIDCGVKNSILEQLWKRFNIIQLPWDSRPDTIWDLKPDGVFISNGPGDPSHPDVLNNTVKTVRDIHGDFPMMGICLGHQIISLAFGGKTFKLPFGHRGANHPVKDHLSGEVMITSQNHGYAVDPKHPLEGSKFTQFNVNDGTVEGIEHLKLPVFSIQYHPEASPGPWDARGLFDRFYRTVRKGGAR